MMVLKQTRGIAVAFVVLVAVASCTLLLPTDALIKPCTDQSQCDDGFVCEQNACLPKGEDGNSSDDGQ